MNYDVGGNTKYLFVTGLNIVGCCSSIDAKKSTNAALPLVEELDAPFAAGRVEGVSVFEEDASFEDVFSKDSSGCQGSPDEL